MSGNIRPNENDNDCNNKKYDDIESFSVCIKDAVRPPAHTLKRPCFKLCQNYVDMDTRRRQLLNIVPHNFSDCLIKTSCWDVENNTQSVQSIIDKHKTLLQSLMGLHFNIYCKQSRKPNNPFHCYREKFFSVLCAAKRDCSTRRQYLQQKMNLKQFVFEFMFATVVTLADCMSAIIEQSTSETAGVFWTGLDDVYAKKFVFFPDDSLRLTTDDLRYGIRPRESRLPRTQNGSVEWRDVINMEELMRNLLVDIMDIYHIYAFEEKHLRRIMAVHDNDCVDVDAFVTLMTNSIVSVVYWFKGNHIVECSCFN
nr:Caab028 [Calliteara abietis nucleopolyhedrovirus]